MAQDYSEERAKSEARKELARLENSRGGRAGVMAGIVEMQSKNPISKIPTSEEIFKQRIAELTAAYSDASDGAGKIDSSNKRLNNVLEGKAANGHGNAVSQKLAQLAGKAEHLVGDIKLPPKIADVVVDFAEDAGRGLAKGAGKFGLPGKAVGAMAGVAVTFAAGNASASTLAEAGLNGVSNGLGTLTIGEGSGRNRLCQIFGDVVVPGAIGVGTSLVATPLAGMAAGTAASLTLSDPSTKACNSFAQKLGF